jgi:hypothetical protein
LPRLTRAKARLTEVELRTLVEADRNSVGDGLGFTNTPLWWANATRQTKPVAMGALKLAQALDNSHEPTRTALAAGAMLPDQARVVIDAVEALPAPLVEPALRREAETHLVVLAEHHDPRELRILGRRILDVIAPEISEAHEKAVLEREEQAALATASFTMRPDGHGSMIGRFKIPTIAGEILAKHLTAIAAPRHRAAVDGEATPRTVARPLRLGQAFVEYLETRAKSGMPKAGGVAATVVVTMTMESLLGGDAAATLDSGERISASEARRLICEASSYSAFLGTRSQVLDLGRKTRFHTEPQRIAIALRDKGCAAADCDWPPGMSHVHHLDPWAKGGGTSVERGILLCPGHHTLAHDARYQMKTSKNGKVTFSRRT